MTLAQFIATCVILKWFAHLLLPVLEQHNREKWSRRV